MIHSYLQQQEHLQYAFVLLDSNISPQKIDLEFINYLGSKTIPFVLAYTKTDRMSQLVCSQNIKAIQKELLKTWQALPPQFITSSEKNRGRDDMLRFLEESNPAYFQHQKQSKV
jgi:GTP-binding protein